MKKIYLLLIFFSSTSIAMGQMQMGTLTLNDAITIAHSKSPQSQMAQLSYMAQYWNYRSYKAQMLPSLNANASLGPYNRSLVEVRNPDTGEISYVANNTLTNDLSLSIDQNIVLTGGKVSLNTNLARLDQFTYKNKIYNSNPLSISYTQPIRSFNRLKWEKRTRPLEYENSKRRYLETMENITISTTQLFFSVLSAQNEYNKTITNYKDTEKLYEIAKKRFDLGTTTKSELLQLELSLLNSDLAINNSRVNLDMAMFSFTSYLGVAENVNLELLPPSIAPDVELNFDMVLDRAYTNSAHKLDMELKRVNAQKEVAQAKANRGLQADFRANLGFSQSAKDFKGAYSTLKDREVVGVTLSMPIYDWGMSRGRVKMAQAQERLAGTEIEQSEIKFIQDIRIKVIKFNNQAKQCDISKKARRIAEERYEITKKRFQNESITVTEINPLIDDKGQIKIRAKVQNRDNYLIEGMNVKIIINNEIKNLYVVPKDAVVLRDGYFVLFRYIDGLAVWTYVDVVMSNIDSHVVTGNSKKQTTISDNDVIITSGNLNLADGTAVKPK